MHAAFKDIGKHSAKSNSAIDNGESDTYGTRVVAAPSSNTAQYDAVQSLQTCTFGKYRKIHCDVFIFFFFDIFSYYYYYYYYMFI